MRIAIICVWVVLICFIFMVQFDYKTNHDRIYNYFVYRKSCDFNIKESGYFLCKIGDRYAIGRHAKYFDMYLTGFAMAGISESQIYIQEPCTFSDSCSAKGYLVAYLKEYQKEHDTAEIKIINQ